MLATYRQQLPPIFGKLPQELYREIYDFDDTYQKIFCDPKFLVEIENMILQIKYPVQYGFIQEFIKYIPNFSIQLLELKKDGNSFQTKNLALRLYMKMIQIIRDDPESFLTNLKDIFYSISQEKDEAKRIYIIKNLLEYLFRARKDAENYTEKEIIKKIEGDYMNLLERIREEGKLEGELKGKLEGKQENKLETARKMLEEGFTLTQISKITGLTEIQLQENGVL
jgi:predicted transposase/invertase (TIGR01784 family)